MELWLIRRRSISIEMDINFREINMGDLYYRSRWSDYPELYEEWKKHESDLPYPNGECGADVWNRCKNSLDIITQYDYERVAIVCHGGTIIHSTIILILLILHKNCKTYQYNTYRLIHNTLCVHYLFLVLLITLFRSFLRNIKVLLCRIGIVKVIKSSLFIDRPRISRILSGGIPALLWFYLSYLFASYS